MAWFICLLYVLAFVFWLLSWRTDELLVAWCRFAAALFCGCVGLILTLIELAIWLFG